MNIQKLAFLEQKERMSPREESLFRWICVVPSAHRPNTCLHTGFCIIGVYKAWVLFKCTGTLQASGWYAGRPVAISWGAPSLRGQNYVVWKDLLLHLYGKSCLPGIVPWLHLLEDDRTKAASSPMPWNVSNARGIPDSTCSNSRRLLFGFQECGTELQN